MALTRYFQVINDNGRVYKTFKTEEARSKFLSSDKLAKDLSDVMSSTTFSTRDIWTNAKEASIEKLVK